MPKIAVLYTPGPRASIEEVATGRDAAYVAIYDNVVGAIHEFRPSRTAHGPMMRSPCRRAARPM